MYDPFDGVWENEDPKGFAAGDSNLGRYSHNNAVMLVDPAGLQEGTNPSLAYIPPPAWLLAQEKVMIENLIIQNQQAMAAAQQQYILAQQAYQMAAQNIPTLSLQGGLLLIMEQQQLNWAAYLQASIATDQAFVDTQMQKYKAYAAQKQMQLAAQTIQQLQQEINEQYEEWQAMQETLELLEQSHPNN